MQPVSLRLAAAGFVVTRFEPRPLPYAVGLSTLLAHADFGFEAEGVPVQGRLVAPAAGEAPPLATLRWTLGAVAGELVLPARVTARLLHAVEPAPRGEIDGATAALLLELALAEPLGRLEAACSEAVRLVEVVPSASVPDPEGFVIGIAGLFDGESFMGSLRVPNAAMGLFRRLAASLPALAAPINPPVALAVRVGVARIGMGLLRSLEPGDAVVLEQPAEARVVVAIGENLVALGRFDGSRVILDAQPRPAAATAMEIWTMSESAGSESAGSESAGSESAGSESAGSESAGSESAGSENAGSERAGSGSMDATGVAPQDASLQDLQVTLVFELARRSATLREVQALVPGHVIELGPLAEQRVSVLANGVRIGEGEIVRVGDVTAVRLTRIAAEPGPPAGQHASTLAGGTGAGEGAPARAGGATAVQPTRLATA